MSFALAPIAKPAGAGRWGATATCDLKIERKDAAFQESGISTIPYKTFLVAGESGSDNKVHFSFPDESLLPFRPPLPDPSSVPPPDSRYYVDNWMHVMRMIYTWRYITPDSQRGSSLRDITTYAIDEDAVEKGDWSYPST